MRRLIDHVVEAGVHGVFALGTTGEFYGLDMAQKEAVMRVTV